jgi:hypothetical protein
MTDEPIDDAEGRVIWSSFGRARAGCPDDLALAAYADRRADATTAEQVEAHLADCREASCLCLAAVAAARQPAIEPVPLAAVIAAQNLVREQPIRRVWRVSQWAAAAAAVVLAAQLGFNLGMSAAAFDRGQPDTEEVAIATDWTGLPIAGDL